VPGGHLFALITTLLVVAASACVPVRSWQRGRLARPDMQLGGARDLDAGEAHARAYREGSRGGGAVTAGGCGCN
jgi:hypothetical protein